MEVVAAYIKAQDEIKRKRNLTLGHDYEIFFNGQSLGKGKTMSALEIRSHEVNTNPTAYLRRKGYEVTMNADVNRVNALDDYIHEAQRNLLMEMERKMFEGLGVPSSTIQGDPTSNIRGHRADFIIWDEMEDEDDN